MCENKWTSQVENAIQKEDQMLIKLKEKLKVKSWCQIGNFLNESGLGKNRTGKQCRERYVNHLMSEFKKEDWTVEQNCQLFELYEKYGSQWAYISSFFNGRPENTIKNKFYGSMRKLLRFLNRVIRQQRKKMKTLGFKSLIRVFQVEMNSVEGMEQAKQNLKDIRKKVFEMILSENEKSKQQTLELIQKINAFNLKTKSYRPKRRNQRNKGGNTNEEKQQDVNIINDYIENELKVEEEEIEENQNKTEKNVELQIGRIWQNMLEDSNYNQQNSHLPSYSFFQELNQYQSAQKIL